MSPASEPLSSPAEAAALVERLRATVAELSALLAQETALVRAAKVRDAGPLEAAKAGLSRRYMADLALLKANAALVRRHAGPALAALEADNAALQSALELNLAVLATAHAVAEGIVRAVSAAVQASRAPSGYGANGRAAGPAPGAAGAPVAVSRRL